MFRGTDVKVNLVVWDGLVRGVSCWRKNGLGHEGKQARCGVNRMPEGFYIGLLSDTGSWNKRSCDIAKIVHVDIIEVTETFRFAYWSMSMAWMWHIEMCRYRLDKNGAARLPVGCIKSII